MKYIRNFFQRRDIEKGKLYRFLVNVKADCFDQLKLINNFRKLWKIKNDQKTMKNLKFSLDKVFVNKRIPKLYK